MRDLNNLKEEKKRNERLLTHLMALKEPSEAILLMSKALYLEEVHGIDAEKTVYLI